MAHRPDHTMPIARMNTDKLSVVQNGPTAVRR